MHHLRIAVGPRLALLVAVEMLTAVAMLVLGLISLEKVTDGSRFLHHFILMPIQQIEVVLDDASRLGSAGVGPGEDAAILGRIGAFAKRYRDEIEVAHNRGPNEGPDVRRQVEEMRKAGRLDLIEREESIVASIERSARELSSKARGAAPSAAEVDGLRRQLRDLARVNLDFVTLAERDITGTAHKARIVLVSVGTAGIILAALLGLQVRRAIAPRIAGLVKKVRKFHEFGIHERAVDEGGDEIAVLANALDTGFAAIASRDRERERFLAVAAHELKTPMVSILGFAQTALDHPTQRERALQIIRRHTGRLARLVEDLLWAASVRAGELPFHPVPLDLAEVARRVAGEVGETLPSHPIFVQGPQNVHVLVDEGLVTHAFWSLLTYGAALSSPDAPLDLCVESNPARVRSTLQVQGPPLPYEDSMRMFEPFSTIAYEGHGSPRAVFGLFLCREIAQIHGGSLRVADQPGVGPRLTLELPS